MSIMGPTPLGLGRRLASLAAGRRALLVRRLAEPAPRAT